MTQHVILLDNTMCNMNGFCLFNVDWPHDSMPRTTNYIYDIARDGMDQALMFGNNHELTVGPNKIEHSAMTAQHIVNPAMIIKMLEPRGDNKPQNTTFCCAYFIV